MASVSSLPVGQAHLKFHVLSYTGGDNYFLWAVGMRSTISVPNSLSTVGPCVHLFQDNKAMSSVETQGHLPKASTV